MAKTDFIWVLPHLDGWKNYVTSANQAPKKHKFKSLKDGIILIFK